jgi:hypothetical protein
VNGYGKISVPGLWHPGFSNWNGKFTKSGPVAIHPASGQMEKPRIGNVDTSMTFHGDPTHICLPGACPIKNITVAEVNAYWNVRYAGATRIGEPTWSHNCHGHSTGLNYWVNDFTVFVYDWEICPTANDIPVCGVRGAADHTIKITGIAQGGSPENPPSAPYKVVTETTEKMAYAGTYKRSYNPPLDPESTFRSR